MLSQKTVFSVVILIFVFSIFAFALANNFKAPTANERVTNDLAARNAANNTDILNENNSGSTIPDHLEGVVKKLPASIYQEGTHYLVVDNITLALLVAKDSSIDLTKYEGKNVKVWGPSKPTVGGDGNIMTVERIEEAK